MTESAIETVRRYQSALSKLMDNDQPTIAQHREFIEQMYICAAAGTIDIDRYFRMAGAHERIIKEKQEVGNDKS